MSDEVVYDDDHRQVHLLDVIKDIGVFGDKVIQFTFDPELDTDDDVEYQDKVAGQKDFTAFSFYDGDYHENRQGIIESSPESQPSGHEWVSSHIYLGEKGIITWLPQKSKTNCGKIESECTGTYLDKELKALLGRNYTDPRCKGHGSKVQYVEYVADERAEFKEDWNSPADRPSENFFLGLAGLREYNELIDRKWEMTNSVCTTCNIMTPRVFDVCQNCESVLV